MEFVNGVGATADPTPPTETVYHNNPVPAAVKGEAVAFKQ
jgi:hypothetical protein